MQQLYQDIANDPALVIHKDIFSYTRSQLHQGINQVFGDPEFDDPGFDLVQRLKSNADRFAGYKSAWQTAHIRNVEPGQMPAINSSYNVNWMRTEYVHTVRSCRAAKNWQAIEQDKDLYPFLEYMPSTAAEPRNEHQRLYGVIKPVNDPFWDTWMPPSDWGCRCSVKQVRSDEGAKQPPTDIKLPPATMRNNPGKTGQLFTDQHPMIKKVGQRNKEVIDRWVDQEAGQVFNAWQKFKGYGSEWQKAAFNAENGGYIVSHKDHQFDIQGGITERKVANSLMKDGYHVEFLTERGASGLSYIDCRVNGEYYEIKGSLKNSHRSIKSQFEGAKRKKAVGLILSIESEMSFSDALTSINRIKPQRYGVNKVWLFKEGNHRVFSYK